MKTTLRVRLTPSGGADRIDGVGADPSGERFLKARVRAAPENGEANAALEILIAKALKAPRSAVSVMRGGKARLKTLAIEGVSAEDVAQLFRQFAEQK